MKQQYQRINLVLCQDDLPCELFTQTSMEKYREERKDLHMVFIDLEKAYDRVPREVMWWILEMKEVPQKYIELIQVMYNQAITSVRTSYGITSEFPITIGFASRINIKPTSLCTSV